MNSNVSLKPFQKEHIPLKVKWINDNENNEFLHYDLPLTVEKTEKWWESVKNRQDRQDFVICYDGIPVGLTGLLNIDQKNKNAELHIILGDKNYKNKGISTKSMNLLLNHAFGSLHLNRVYLYVEEKNQAAIRLYEKTKFIKEGCLRKHIKTNKGYYDYLIWGILREEFI